MPNFSDTREHAVLDAEMRRSALAPAAADGVQLVVLLLWVRTNTWAPIPILDLRDRIAICVQTARLS